MNLENASPADLPAIRTLEARPDNAGKIGSWSQEEHLGTMARPGTRYFVWRENGRLRAFAIFERLDDVRGVSAYLRRLATDAPGRGDGAPFLTALLDWLFTETNSQKLELRCRVGNPAANLYHRFGFVEEGVLTSNPERIESYVMTLTRAQWRDR